MRNLFVHCCCNDRLFSYSVPIFIFKLILTIYTVYRAQSFRIRVAEDGFDNFKQTFYNVSTQTHFCAVQLLQCRMNSLPLDLDVTNKYILTTSVIRAVASIAIASS